MHVFAAITCYNTKFYIGTRGIACDIVPNWIELADEWTCVATQVKNTFLDDVVREQSSNESTLVEAQTCPEFRNRKDGLSSSSASHSGASASVATHSDWLGDQELMPNTLQTLSTPPASLRYQVPNGCQADVVDFTDVIPRTPLELWHDQMKSQEALLCALQAMPDAPFRHLLSPPPPPYLGKIPGAINANLNAAASAAFSPLPNVPWAPVLSTIPPANEFLAPVSWIVCRLLQKLSCPNCDYFKVLTRDSRIQQTVSAKSVRSLQIIAAVYSKTLDILWLSMAGM